MSQTGPQNAAAKTSVQSRSVCLCFYPHSNVLQKPFSFLAISSNPTSHSHLVQAVVVEGENRHLPVADNRRLVYPLVHQRHLAQPSPSLQRLCAFQPLERVPARRLLLAPPRVARRRHVPDDKRGRVDNAPRRHVRLEAVPARQHGRHHCSLWRVQLRSAFKRPRVALRRLCPFEPSPKAVAITCRR